MVQGTLIQADDSVLIVIYVQEAFTKKLPPGQAQPLVNRICWLVDVAKWLDVPVVATAEDIPTLGGVDPQLGSALPDGTLVHNKMAFGLAENPDILQAVGQTGRRTAVLTGLETDVCVAQSAVGLLDRGYDVAVIKDATAASPKSHVHGLERARDVGAVVIGLKGLFYEWMRTVPLVKEFHAEWVGPTPSDLGWRGYWDPIEEPATAVGAPSVVARPDRQTSATST